MKIHSAPPDLGLVKFGQRLAKSFISCSEILIVIFGLALFEIISSVDNAIINAHVLKTLPEKCVWGAGSEVVYCAVPKSINQGEYPDSWYQGEISFSDAIWKIDVASGSTTMISDPTTVPGGEDVDAIKLSLDQNQNYLFFVNKKDSYLWELSLK